MKTLYDFIKESMVLEGGASGHLSHIIDYDDMTLDELKGLMYNLFNNRIEDITEKIDGMNIQASMNDAGEVVFIRNRTDLNSETGGMTVDDMRAKWAGKERVQRVFTESGESLQRVFKKVGKKFFNPNRRTRVFANCECMVEGTTNIMPYISSKVFIHDLWVYTKTSDGWEHTETTKKGIDTITSAMDEEDNVTVTPNVIVDTLDASATNYKKYMVQLNAIFKKYGLKYKSTINDYKRARFDEWVSENAPWMLENEEGMRTMYERIIHGDKSTGIGVIKKTMYPQNGTEVSDIDKRAKEIAGYCTTELDSLFLNMSNDIISLCRGFINDAKKNEVVDELIRNLKDTVTDIENDDDAKEETKNKMMVQLQRLDAMNNRINATEGIVFRYKGRLMKCTGAFAPLNQILGSIKYNR